VNANTLGSLRSESRPCYSDHPIDISNSKREKFLFENDDRNLKIPDTKTIVVQYKTAMKYVSEDCVMRVTVDAGSVKQLRQLILNNCGGCDFYMKVKAIDHASKMKVWLCLNKSSIDILISKILRSLPHAEFGRITPIQAH
jgi:hypothetical protein